MSVSSIVEYCIKRLMGKMKIEYVLLGLLAFFVVVAIYRYFKGKKGTYNNGYVMPPTYTHPVHTNMPATASIVDRHRHRLKTQRVKLNADAFLKPGSARALQKPDPTL